MSSAGVVERGLCAIEDEIAKQEGLPTSAISLLSRPILLAVLKAIREPSARMVGHGEGYSDFILPQRSHDNTGDGRRKEMRMAYQCMVDALIKELAPPLTNERTYHG